MNPDPDPGGPKTCGSCGSGSPTLVKTVNKQHVFKCISCSILTEQPVKEGTHEEEGADKWIKSTVTPSMPE